MPNGHDTNGTTTAELIKSLPVWAKVAVVLGPNFVITMGLMAVVMGWIDSPMNKAVNQNAAMIQLLQKHDNDSTYLRRELLSAFDYSNLLGRTLCRNMVPSQAQFQCEPKYRGYDESKQ